MVVFISCASPLPAWEAFARFDVIRYMAIDWSVELALAGRLDERALDVSL